MTTRLGAINFDCLDVQRQARFWSAVLDLQIDPAPDPEVAEFVATAHGPGMSMMFIKTDERAAGKNQVHLDLFDEDYPAVIDHLVELGAEKVADFDEYGTVWTTLRDPEGNLFDIARPH